MKARALSAAAVAATARKTWHALGWPGAAGLVALALAAALALLAQRWDADAAALQRQAEQLRGRLRAQQLAAPTAAAQASPQQWLARLPSARERQQRLADLLEIALRLGLNSQRTEHRLSVDAAAGLERLRVTMPLTGGYAQLRQFIEAALAHDAALSLDGLKLRRASPQATELDAELVWSLHARSEAVAAAAPALEKQR